MEKVIVYFPDYSGGNPYQKLLYRPCSKAGWSVMPGTIDLALSKRMTASEVIFHVHWLNAIFKDCKGAVEAWVAAYDFIMGVTRLIAQGGKVIWTIHNHLPHEKRFAEQDLRIRHFLCKQAHRIHIHCATHIDELDYLPIDLEKVAVHRHGNYIGYYREFAIAERIEQINRGDLRAAFIGMLRGYKSIDSLLTVAEDLISSGIPVTIAGQPENEDIRKTLEAFGARTGATLILRRLTEAEVGDLCAENSIGILSYDKILTSGTLKLYLSFGMLVIAPELPTIKAEDRYCSLIYTSNGAETVGQRLVGAGKEQLAALVRTNYLLAQESRWSADLFEWDISKRRDFSETQAARRVSVCN